MSQHILYWNDSANIVVLDLPTSIARGQLSKLRLRSAPAPSIPYTTPEPKGAKLKHLLSAVPAHEGEYHNAIQKILSDALGLLKEQWNGAPWCHQRVDIIEEMMPNNSQCLIHHGNFRARGFPPPLVLSRSLNNVCCVTALTDATVHNPHNATVSLATSTNHSFTIPPRSVFLNATIERGIQALEEAVRLLIPGQSFDLVLLDPPWSNRSVRNSKAYHSAESQISDPFVQVLPLVTTYLGKNGYLAVWITNKAAIRSTVLNLCCNFGLVLEEEWIWLKITKNGEAVVPLNGIWRKPYEVLLMFRRSTDKRTVTRRVGLAVPDLHSRKPSLKSMFEQILPQQYCALEVFARSLTAGWWSWGNEVLKFQHENQWV